MKKFIKSASIAATLPYKAENPGNQRTSKTGLFSNLIGMRPLF